MCLLEIDHSYTCKDCYADYAFVNYNAVIVLNLLLVVKCKTRLLTSAESFVDTETGGSAQTHGWQ
jgi:hypothetical protein